MKFGFNPRLRPLNRRYLVERLREAIACARELGMSAIELSCTEDMTAMGLQNVFGGEFMETLLHVRDLRFHLHVLYGEHSVDEVAISDTSQRARALYLRTLCGVIEFFEHARPMQLYILNAGPKIVDAPSHLKRLLGSLDCLRTLYPDLPLALENGRPGTLLAHGPEFMDFLDIYPDVSFVFDTASAYQAVGYSKELYAHFLRGLSRFVDRLAEIRWRNVGPGTNEDVPLHVPIERGVDLPGIARHLGRNPASIHMIDTAAGCQPTLLARDRRALSHYLSVA